jgi:hypothetical protein
VARSHGGWIHKLETTRRVLFHLPQLRKAIAEAKPVYLAEGEKDVLALEGAGVAATCNPMGAGKWGEEYSEMLRGADVVIVQDEDEPGRAHARRIAAALQGVARAVRIVAPALGKDAHDHLTAGKTVAEFRPVETDADRASTPVGRQLVIVRLSEVVARPPEYLWYPWLPRRTFVELGGDPGAGKTFLACELIACGTNGRRPGGAPGDEVSVVFMAGEDNLEMVLKPRLDAAGANHARITSIKGTQGPDGGLDDLLIEQNFHAIVEHVRGEGAGLVYIDCLVDVLADHDGHGYTQTRRAMRFLPRLAEETGAVVLATRHMKKTGDGIAWKQSIGSVGYTSRSRVSLQVYQDREDDGRRVLACALHRMGEMPPSLAFRLEGGDASSGVPPHVGWIGENHRSANDLAAEAAKTERDAPAKDRGAAWLTQRLAAGPVDRETLFAEGEALDLSRACLYRAAGVLGVVKHAEPPASFGTGRRSTWGLAHTSQSNEPLGETNGKLNDLAHTSQHTLDETYVCKQCGNGDAIEWDGQLWCPKCNMMGYVRAVKARAA